MPSGMLVFRAACGCFVYHLIHLLGRRAERARERMMKVVVLSRRSSGVLFGTVLYFFFWSSFWGSLLLQCGDVEMNPGPPKQIQTRLSSSGAGSKAGTPPSDPSLADLMEKLNGMDSRMNEKLDGVQNDVAAIKQQFGRLQGEVDGLKREMESLRQENRELKDHNNALWSKVEGLRRGRMIWKGGQRGIT